MNQVDAAPPTYVFLVPTRTIDLYSQGIDLAKLVKYLNTSIRRVIHSRRIQLRVITTEGVEETFGSAEEYKYTGLDLRQTRPFLNFKLADTGVAPGNTLAVARDTAIVDTDAFKQLQAYALSAVGEQASRSGIIIGIGSEVISEDNAESEWTGIKEEDAYSCLGDIMTLDVSDNDIDRPFLNVCFISLARAYSKNVFGPRLSDSRLDEPARRAIVARYIVANIAHALSSILFRHPLPREHGSLCVAETAWSGGELQSYAATGLCESCRRDAQNGGVARYYAGTLGNWVTACRSIDALTQASNMIDKDVGFYDRFKRWLEFTIAAGFIGTFIALLVTYDSKDPPLLFLEAHWPASLVILVFLISTVCAYVRFWLKSRAIP